MGLYAQTTGRHSTRAGNFVPIPGLTFTLPEGVGISALVILNLPNPYATGDDHPGATLGIPVNGVISHVVASFTYSEQAPSSSGRVPTTLVVSIPLGTHKQTIVAMWSGVRGSTVFIDSPATLSAILT
jgi:mannose-binding lectin